MADRRPFFQIRLHFLGLLVLSCVILPGCGKPSAAKEPTPKAVADAPSDPMEAEREQMRQGATQLTQAVDSIHDAVDSQEGLSKSSKDAALLDALKTIADDLDSAGSEIADFCAEPPELETFRTQFDAQDKKRLAAIEGANDALHDLDDATDALDAFLDKSDPADKEAIQDLEDSMEEAQDSLTEAVKSLGGQVEGDDTTDVPTSPNTQNPTGG